MNLIFQLKTLLLLGAVLFLAATPGKVMNGNN